MKSAKGQAIFELIVFLPFFILMFYVFIVFSGAINGSINQQKVTRGYYFHRQRGNSMIPSTDDLKHFIEGGITKVGMYAYIWGTHQIGMEPVASCYKMSGVVSPNPDEMCEARFDSGQKQTKFIKIFTAFGVCTAFFVAENNRLVHRPSSGFDFINSCVIDNQ